MKNPPQVVPGRVLQFVTVSNSIRASALVEQLCEAALLAVAPGAAMPRITREQRQYRGGLGEDHLLHRRGDFAPTCRLLECRGGAGAVADVGDGDLHCIFVDLDVVMTEDL